MREMDSSSPAAQQLTLTMSPITHSVLSVLDAHYNAFLPSKEGVPSMPLSLVLVEELKPKVADKLRRQLMQLNEGNVLAQTCTSTTTESHHILVHVIGTSCIQPSARVEAVGVLSKDLLVEMHHGGVDTNNIASRDELIADSQALRGYSSR